MRALERIWWRRDEPVWAEALLWPLSLLSLFFRAGAAMHAKLASPQRARAKVISVGNLAVGGAGKSPVAMLLCEQLRARGHRPAFLSRGYGRRNGAPLSVVCEGSGPLLDARAAGDEPLLVARRCPWLTVLVGADRALLAQEAQRRGADVLVLDDGLQHHALARDLDVIVIDAKALLGNDRRLPRGPLREGAEAFARVGSRGLLWLSNARDVEENESMRTLLDAARQAGLRGPVRSATIAQGPADSSMPSPLDGSASLRGVPVYLLAGIARPERFAETVRALGAEIRGSRFFADHHPFTATQLANVRKAALGAGATRIVTTEKDAARIPATEMIGTPTISALPIELEILSGEELLTAALDTLLEKSA